MEDPKDSPETPTLNEEPTSDPSASTDVSQPESSSETPTETPSETSSETETPAASPFADTQSADEQPKPVVDGGDRPIAASEPPKSGGSKWLWIILAVVVVAALAAGAYMLMRPANKSASTVKKDIPLINYGLSDGTLTATYPLGGTDTSIMFQVNSQLFEGLVGFKNETQIVPLLATNWYNPNDTTWVFNLRQGVKFHNGKSFTAQDVKSSLDYAIAHQNDPNPTSSLSLASTIKQVDVNSTYQVKITTDGPDPTLLNRLAQLYIFDTKATLGDPNAGTGPYILKPGTKPTETSMDLVAIDNYWGGHVYTKAVHIGAVTDTSKLGSETAQGQFDIAGDLPNDQLAKIHSSRVLNVPDLGISFLGLNTEKAASPLSNLAARQAVAYALNIPAILRASGARGEQASQLIPTAIPGHDPSITNTPYNPTKARELLATVKNAATPVTLSYPSGDETKAAEMVKELDAVGFNVQLSKQPDISTAVNVDFSGQVDLYYLSYTSNILDGLDILGSLTTGNKVYDNPQNDNLANQASSTLDPSTRIKLLQQMSRQIAKDIPDVPLFTQTRSYVLMKPYHLSVDLPSTEAGLYFWQIYQ